MLDWENSPHFAKPTLVSPRKETTVEILYWWRVTIKVWVALLIGWSPRGTTNQRHGHQYRISAQVSQTSFRGETSADCREMSAVFLGCRNVSKIRLKKLVIQSMLQISFNPSQVTNWVKLLCSKKKLAYSSWFHQRFEHFDVISTVNKSVDHRIFLSICKQNIREFDKRLRHWS